MPSYINFQDDTTYPGHKFRRMVGRQQDLAQGFDHPIAFTVSVSNDNPGKLEASPGVAWIRDEIGGVYFVEREIDPLYVDTVGSSGTIILRVKDLNLFDGENALVLEAVAQGSTIPVRSLRLATYTGSGSDAVLTDVRLTTPGQFVVSRSGPSNYGAPNTEVMGLGSFAPGTQYTDLTTGVRYVKKADGVWFSDPVPKGDKGDTGPQGIQGVQGIQGTPGATGPQGIQGIPGKDGVATPYGVTLPSGWGANWKAKLATAASGGKARMVVVGGSSSQGYYASNLATGGWVGYARAALQGQYGNGGSGMFPASRSPRYINGAQDAAALAAWQANQSVCAATGAWTLGGTRTGPGATQIYTTEAAATLTFKVTGTTLKVYTVMGTGRADFTYSIDGATAVNVPNVGSLPVAVTTISGLAAGDHTVVLKHNGVGGGDNYLTVIAVSGENASGVVVDNMAKAGAPSETFATNVAWNGGASYPADLAIFTAGPNDVTGGVTPDQWETNVLTFISAAKAANPLIDIMLLLPHFGKHTNDPTLYLGYAAKARSIQAAQNVALVDMWTRGLRSWDYMNAQSFWGNADIPGAVGTNSVHPGDLGYSIVASTVAPLLTG